MGGLVKEDAARAEYLELLPHLVELRAVLTAELRRFATHQSEINSRIKTWESVREKLLRSSWSRVTDITDLVGVRLIVPDVRSLLEVSDGIKEQFHVTSMNAQTLRIRESAMHFVLQSGSSFPNNISAEVEVLTAAEDARRILAHELHYLASPDELHRSSLVEAKIESLTDVVDELEYLINRHGVHEKRDIHPFLERHTFLLFANSDEVSSEVPIGLGTEFRIDFLVQKPDSSYLLVEIENPQAPLFTKLGDFSGGVNHAIRQVEDWQEWIEANLQTVERRYPGIRAPEALVVIGRDLSLSNVEKCRLARRNSQTGGSRCRRCAGQLPVRRSGG
jgi:ppGpp synthetase/RelA/SpoT-type nucleotidyltranferase